MKKAGWTTKSMDDIGIFTYLSAKQCDIRSFFVEPYIGCPYPCPWVLGGHGCNIIVHGWAWFMGWFMLNMEGKDDFEMENSTKELVQCKMANMYLIPWKWTD